MASTVILGSGIIGLSTAYYLADHQPGPSIHLVDASTELFSSASGYAGGFLAKTSFHPTVSSLGKLSFEEHERLAAKENGREKWGYSKSLCINYERRASPVGNGREQPKEVERDAGIGKRDADGDIDVPLWLRRVDTDEVEVADNEGGTAVVDPKKLCQFLLEKCKAAGVQVHHPATALSVATDVRGELASVCIGYTDSSAETEIPATRLLLSSGAWTPQVFKSLFNTSSISIPVTSLAGHSLVVRRPTAVKDDNNAASSYSLICKLGELERVVFSRENGEIYLAGVNSTTIPLPELATGATPEAASMGVLKKVAQDLIASETDLEVVREGLCFRPMTSRRTPIITRIKDEDLGSGVTTRVGEEGGVFVATGHGQWGISLGLGTGKVVAEMMQGRKVSADVGSLGL